MLIKSIRLNNIRSYDSQSIEFNEGSTLLIGDIGSGKTTILLAIEFAMFGLIKGDISGSTLLSHGKKEGSVELSFEIDNKEVTITRKLKRGRDSVTQDAGQIIINNTSFDGTPIELKSKILELFGYPEELLNKNTSLIYRYTVYTPQEDMKKILFESKDERLDTLRKIFNIDKYKKIRENALAYAKELRNSKKILEAKIQDLEQLKLDLNKFTESKNKLLETLNAENKNNSEQKSLNIKKLEEIKSYETKIAELNILKKDLEITIINLRNKKEKSEKNSKDLNMAMYRIQEYNNKLKELGIIDQDEVSIRAALTDAEDKFSKVSNAKEVIGKRLEDKERDLQNMIIDDVASLTYQLASITKKLESKTLKEKELEETTIILDKSNIDLNTISVNKLSSTKVLNQLKDLSTCPTCLQTVDFTHKIKIVDKESANILSFDRKIVELTNKKKDLDEKIKTLKLEIEELRKDELKVKEFTIKLENISKQQELKTELQREVEELKNKKEKLDAMDVNKLVEVISKNRKILNTIGVKKHIDDSLKEKELQKKDCEENSLKLQEELKILNEKKENIENNISNYVDLEKEYLTQKNELNIITKNLKDSDIRLVSINKDIENAQTQLTKISEEIAVKNKLKDKIKYISELNYWITEHIVNLTATIEKTIMQKIHLEFNELFQKWFVMLMEYENIEVFVNEEFTPIIIQNNYETEITNLSGGEKTSVALAYRLALNKVINDLINNIKTKDLIILDEPTDGFSSEQLDKMREVLQELNIKQLIMVSHESKIESFVQNIIRVSKQDNSSVI